jgi:hypothetical protein
VGPGQAQVVAQVIREQAASTGRRGPLDPVHPHPLKPITGPTAPSRPLSADRSESRM